MSKRPRETAVSAGGSGAKKARTASNPAADADGDAKMAAKELADSHEFTADPLEMDYGDFLEA